MKRKIVFLILIVFLTYAIIVLIRMLVFQNLIVISSSMEPLLAKNDYVIVLKDIFRYNNNYNEGDIIVFTSMEDKTIRLKDKLLWASGLGKIFNSSMPQLYVKRIIGTPGSIINITGKDISLNNDELKYSQLQLSNTNPQFLSFSIPYYRKYIESYAGNDWIISNTFRSIDYHRQIIVPKEGSKLTVTRSNQNMDWIYPGELIKKCQIDDIDISNDEFNQFYRNIIPDNIIEPFLSGESLSLEYIFEKNYYFVLGDNRDNSLDSRDWGFLSEEKIVGTPIVIYYPFNRFSEL